MDMNDGSADGLTYFQNFLGYNIITLPLFMTGIMNIYGYFLYDLYILFCFKTTLLFSWHDFCFGVQSEHYQKVVSYLFMHYCLPNHTFATFALYYSLATQFTCC